MLTAFFRIRWMSVRAAFPSAEPEQREPSKSQAPETELIEPLSER